jgi:hypothetical protein
MPYLDAYVFKSFAVCITGITTEACSSMSFTLLHSSMDTDHKFWKKGANIARTLNSRGPVTWEEFVLVK